MNIAVETCAPSPPPRARVTADPPPLRWSAVTAPLSESRREFLADLRHELLHDRDDT